MKIIQIHGGLGNQLFQYAFARVMSLEQNKNIFLDVSFYNFSKNRNYDLSKFHIANFKMLKLPLFYMTLKFFNTTKINKLVNKFIYFEKHSCKYSKINYNKFKYYSGYFQSEKYFSKYRNILLDELKLKKPINPNVLSHISNTQNSVAIHIRRGDYFNKNNILHYNTFTIDYYYEAINLISTKLKNPFFFIFSDDIKWCKQNLKINYLHKFMNISNPEVDLILISKCEHQILSNSTYGWWGGGG